MKFNAEHKQINPHLRYVEDKSAAEFPPAYSGYGANRRFLGIFRWLVLFILWLIIVVLWVPQIFPKEDSFGVMSAIIICVKIFVSGFIFYSLYHLTALTFALFGRHTKSPILSQVKCDIPVGLILTVCDDFQESAAQTLLELDYKHFHVYICDDSRDLRIRNEIDLFQHKNEGKTTIIRRQNNVGFKAGNINHALRTGLITEPLIVLVDADERLESNFLRMLLTEFKYSDASFLQASHKAVDQGTTRFQRMLSPSLAVYWVVHEQLRNSCGFPVAHGHGVLFPRAMVEQLGGFDESTTSEDIDISYKIALSRRFGRGYISSQTWGSEEIPRSIKHYHMRFCRWLKQDLLLALRVLPKLLYGYLSTSEYFDVFIRQFHIPICGLALPYLFVLGIFMASSRTSLNQASVCTAQSEICVPVVAMGFLLCLSPIFPVLFIAHASFARRVWCAAGLVWLLNSLIVESGLTLAEFFVNPFRVKFVPTGSLKQSQIKKKSVMHILPYIAIIFLAVLSSCALLGSMMLAALGSMLAQRGFKYFVNCAAAILFVVGFLQLLEHPAHILVLLPLGAFRY